MKGQGNLEVAKIYRGTTEVSKIYRGTSLYYDKDVHPDILLNYIANGPDNSNTRLAYFDTGVVVGAFLPKVEVKAATYNTSTACTIMGGVKGSSWDGVAIDAHRNGNAFVSARLNATVLTADVSCNSNEVFTVTAYLDDGDVDPSNSNRRKGYLIYNNQSYSPSYIPVPTNRGISMYLFAQNRESGTAVGYTPSGTKIYYVKIWDNNNLIRFYIPVLHFVDGQYVACFYDKVNGNYIYNIGTDDVVYSATNYYLLDYIGNGVSVSGTGNGVKSSDAKYDSGVAISRDVNSDVAFVYGNNNTGSNQEAFIIGDRDSNSNKFGYMFSNAYLRVPGYNITSLVTSSDTKYRVSCYYNSIAGYNRRAYVNDTLYSNSNTSSAPANTANLFLFGSGTTNVWAGTQIYYALFATKNCTTTKTLIPILANGLPVYYDLNTNTYISNEGTGYPTYKLITS